MLKIDQHVCMFIRYLQHQTPDRALFLQNSRLSRNLDGFQVAGCQMSIDRYLMENQE